MLRVAADQPHAGHHEDKEEPRWVGITVFGEMKVVAEETKNTSLPTRETLPGGLREDQYNTGSENRDQHGPKSFLFMFTRASNQCSPGGSWGRQDSGWAC